MKKIIAASLFIGLFTSVGAFAATAGKIPDITLSSGAFIPVGNVTTDINIARQGRMLAQGGRAGFVKNSFDFTISANVVAGVLEEPARSRFGVSAGSNKGYNVFTGSSVGGSISQCGDQIAKDITNLGASEVKSGVIVLDNANGCGRVATP
ncbi:MAG: hypothetical protein ACKVIS_19560 [Pseudomonadales bacterium]